MASDADEKCGFTAPGSSIHQSNEGRKVDVRSLLLGTAKAARKVPVIASWRQRRPPLSGDIFAHRVLARFEKSVAVAVGKIQLKALFHAAPIEWEKTKNSAVGVGIGHRQGRHIDDTTHGCAGGQHMHRLGSAQQHRPDGNISAGRSFEQVVSDISGVDIG